MASRLFAAWVRSRVDFHGDARRQVHDAHGRLDLVDVLAAGAARSRCRDLQIVIV